MSIYQNYSFKPMIEDEDKNSQSSAKSSQEENKDKNFNDSGCFNPFNNGENEDE